MGCGLKIANIEDCRYIGYGAFFSCYSLSEVYLCSLGVSFGESNGTYAQFADCRTLNVVGNLEYLQEFPPNALYYCSAISKLRLDNCTRLLYGTGD